MNQETLHSLTNLSRCESLRKQMKRHQKRRFGLPVGEMKRNLLRLQTGIVIRLSRKRRRDGGSNACRISSAIQYRRPIPCQFAKNGLNLVFDRWRGFFHEINNEKI